MIAVIFNILAVFFAFISVKSVKIKRKYIGLVPRNNLDRFAVKILDSSLMIAFLCAIIALQCA
jgi:hypothetical protein